MNNALNPETHTVSDSCSPSVAETDAVLETVGEQLDLDTFDPDNHALLRQMVNCLGDTRGLVRLRVAETLGEIGEPATPFLLDALANHANVVVRRAAAKTLTIIADRRAVPGLVHALLNDEDTVVKGSSVGALARMGEAAVPVLLEILASPDHPESTKGHAAWALSFIGVEAKDYLYREIHSDSLAVRTAVLGAIAKIAQEQPEAAAFEVLVSALTDPNETLRIEAASALGNLAYQPAIPNLIELLNHPGWESRKAAALSLMKIGEACDRTSSERTTILTTLQTAQSRETEAALQPIFKLAIAQIEKQSVEEGWE